MIKIGEDRRREELRKLGTKLQESADDAITKQLGDLIMNHVDLKYIFSERTVLTGTVNIKVDYDEENHTIHSMVSNYKLVYRSPSLFARIKFFVLDISLWLKEKLVRK